MTGKSSLAILIALASLCTAIAQESPTPTPAATPEDSLLLRIPSPTPEESPSLTPTPSLTPEESPAPSPSASPSRSARLRFVPPPMEGTISLGIFDENGKLMRVLHREAKIEDFTVQPDGLSTTWDGKNGAGEDLPPGRYRGRGYLVGHIKAEDLGNAKTPPKGDPPGRVAVRLMENPLVSDTRSIVDVTVGLDPQGSFLMTMDGLPLFTVSKTPNLVRVLITKAGEKSVDIWQDDGAVVEQFRVSNIDQMMAFDCGFFELK